MTFRPTLIALAAIFTVALGGCDSELAPIDEARAAYFEAVDGTDEDCEGWLDWCINQGYAQWACEERHEYCVDGEWVGDDAGDGDRPGDDDDATEDPCDEVAAQAERDCLEAGGTAEECREAYADAYDDCADQ